MARPKVIQLDQGKVSLQDFPPDVSADLVDHIKAFFNPPTTLQLSSSQDLVSIIKEARSDLQTSFKTLNEVKLDTLQDVSLAVKIDKKNLKVYLVEVKYNIETKEAVVTHTEEFDNAREASVKFKVKAADLNFV